MMKTKMLLLIACLFSCLLSTMGEARRVVVGQSERRELKRGGSRSSSRSSYRSSSSSYRSGYRGGYSGGYSSNTVIVTGGGYGGSGYGGYYDSYYGTYDTYNTAYSEYGYAGVFKRQYDKAYYPSAESPCLPDDLECQRDSQMVGWIGFGIFAAIVCCFFGGGSCLKCCKNKRSY